MTGSVQIFVKLLDEGVDVWRPVQARHEHDGIFTIIDQPYDHDTEVWEFGPGAQVLCEMIDSSDGPILAATGLDES